MFDSYKIIRDLTLTYEGHGLRTNHAQGIWDFMRLHQIPGATQVINLVKAVNFDALALWVDGDCFVITRRS